MAKSAQVKLNAMIMTTKSSSKPEAVRNIKHKEFQEICNVNYYETAKLLYLFIYEPL